LLGLLFWRRFHSDHTDIPCSHILVARSCRLLEGRVDVRGLTFGHSVLAAIAITAANHHV
jgi:hypothetical protein